MTFHFADNDCGEGVRRIARGGHDGTVCLCAHDGDLLVVMQGEPPGLALLDCFETARQEGWVLLSMKTLVDLTDFVGVVDWQAINRLRQIADWGGEEGKSRTAYLIRNDSFVPIIKITATLFRGSSHRAFTDRALAAAWLGAQ